MIRIEFKIPTDDYEIYLFLLNRITFKVNSSHYEPNYTQNTGISQ